MSSYKEFEKIIERQVFEKIQGRRPRLTRLEKIFILRCTMERWEFG